MSVFGALNRFISHLDSDSSFPSGRAKLAPAGFQVLRNTDPELPIEPWYDFIIGINGRSIVGPPSQRTFPHLSSQRTGLRGPSPLCHRGPELCRLFCGIYPLECKGRPKRKLSPLNVELRSPLFRGSSCATSMFL